MKKTLSSLFRSITTPFLGKGLGKIPGLVWLHKRVHALLSPSGTVRIKTNNLFMHVPTNDSGIAPELLRTGMYEPFETCIFKDIVREGMVVANVGANIGYYTIIAGSKVGENGRVYAFEPVPQNLAFLKKNIEENNLKNCVVFPEAVGDVPGKINIFLDSQNIGNPSVSEKNVHGESGHITVGVKTLGEHIRSYDPDLRVDLLQMDVQGSEGLVLEGAQEILAKNKNIKILMEFWPHGLRNAGSDPHKVLHSLVDEGFAITLLDTGKKKSVPVQPDDVIEHCISTKEGKGFVNLLLARA